jgi:DNA-directed RNA polymerase subunit N (RpoN/RPB10)
LRFPITAACVGHVRRRIVNCGQLVAGTFHPHARRVAKDSALGPSDIRCKSCGWSISPQISFLLSEFHRRSSLGCKSDPNVTFSTGYSAFLYRPRDVREYEEGFGPSVSVRVGDDDTVWKRSRNKWNPFEKIRTIEGVQDSNFSIMWDRTRANSYYVTERMYYYLDKEKHKEKFSGMRGKLYPNSAVFPLFLGPVSHFGIYASPFSFVT